MTVIDASLAVAYPLHEEGWEDAESVLRAGVTAPDLLVPECGNAIVSAKRSHRLTAEQAPKVFGVLRTLVEEVVEIRSCQPYLESAYKVADSTGLAFHDAVYLALARQESMPLATLDRLQLEAVKHLGIRSTHRWTADLVPSWVESRNPPPSTISGIAPPRGVWRSTPAAHDSRTCEVFGRPLTLQVPWPLGRHAFQSVCR